MNDFEFLEHTADVKFRAYGKDYEELFKNAARAMFEVLKDLNQVSHSETVKVKLEAKSAEQLFVKWLDELLYQSQVEDLLFSTFNVKIDDKKWSLTAEVGGDFIKNYKELGPEIKAVTMHQFEFGQQNGLKYCQVILDI